jgi:hypothetical protein
VLSYRLSCIKFDPHVFLDAIAWGYCLIGIIFIINSFQYFTQVHRVLIDIVSAAANATQGLSRYPPFKREASAFIFCWS